MKSDTLEKYIHIDESDPDYQLKRALLRDDDNYFELIDSNTNLLRNGILEITRELAAMCDGAITEDGCGFNKSDTDIGRTIARVGIGRPGKGWDHSREKIKKIRVYPVYFDSKQLQAWARRLYKYKGQIRGNFLRRIFGCEQE